MQRGPAVPMPMRNKTMQNKHSYFILLFYMFYFFYNEAKFQISWIIRRSSPCAR